MPPRACPLPHVDPDKIQVDPAVLLAAQQAQAAALSAQAAAQDKVLEAYRSIDERIAEARRQERESYLALRSENKTDLDAANRCLREQVEDATRHHVARDARIMELLRENGELRAQIGELQGKHTDLALAQLNAEQSLRLATLKAQAEAHRTEKIIDGLAPLRDVAKIWGLSLGGTNPSGATGGAAGDGASAGGADDGKSADYEAMAWSHEAVRAWRRALADLVAAISDETAASYVVSLGHLVGLLSTPEVLPEHLQLLVRDVGPERIRAFQQITAAARPK